MPIRRIPRAPSPSEQAASLSGAPSPRPSSSPISAAPASSLSQEAVPPAGGTNTTQSGSYDIGYGRPPRHTRFKPGQSGNPKGRPKAAKGLKTIVRETLTQKVAVRTASGEKKISRINAVLHKLVELAMKGNPRAMAELLKLYGAAVPDGAANDAGPAPEELSATDLAILEQLKASLAGEAL